MEELKNQPEVINLRLIIREILNNKRLFFKVLPVVFVLACIYTLSIPRYYTSEVKLAPETANPMSNSALGSIASSFGIDLSNMESTDAINPLLYPDLMEDNGFATSIFGIKVKSLDGEINTTYYDYLKHYQKQPWWGYPISWFKQLFKQSSTGSSSEFNPYHLSKDEDDVANAIRNKVMITVDKKNAVISINAEAQDPLICKTLADSVKERLQQFITDYRTNKARIDYEYYKVLTMNAKHEYEKARQMYGSMSDANSKVVLRSVELKMEDMENDMQLKFNAFTTLSTQLEASKAKVQERTPAFTVLKGAAVPVKHSGPKRMITVLGLLFLAFTCTLLYILRNHLFSHFRA